MAEKNKEPRPRGAGSKRARNASGTIWELRFIAGRTSDGKAIPGTEHYHAEGKTFRAREDDAENRLREVIKLVKLGRYFADEGTLVSEFLRSYLRVSRPDLADRTYARYEQLVTKNILNEVDGVLAGPPFIGAIPIAKLRPSHVRELYAHLRTNGRVRTKGGLSNATVAQSHAILLKAFKAAVDDEVLEHSPMEAVKRPKLTRPKVDFLMAVELDQVVERLRNTTPELYIGGLLAAYAGLRRGECLGLRWTDLVEKLCEDGRERIILNVEQSLQQIPKKHSKPFMKDTKTDRSRRIIIDAELSVELRHHRALHAAKRLAAGSSWDGTHDLVICRADGRPYPPGTFSADFRNAVAKAQAELKIPAEKRINHKGFRHSCLSRLASEGNDLLTVQGIAGHTSAVTTNRYFHGHEGNQLVAAERSAKTRAANLARGA